MRKRIRGMRMKGLKNPHFRTITYMKESFSKYSVMLMIKFWLFMTRIPFCQNYAIEKCRIFEKKVLFSIKFYLIYQIENLSGEVDFIPIVSFFDYYPNKNRFQVLAANINSAVNTKLNGR